MKSRYEILLQWCLKHTEYFEHYLRALSADELLGLKKEYFENN